jgi:hypothetical protein
MLTNEQMAEKRREGEICYNCKRRRQDSLQLLGGDFFKSFMHTYLLDFLAPICCSEMDLLFIQEFIVKMMIASSYPRG